MTQTKRSPAQLARDRLIMRITIPLGLGSFLLGQIGSRTGAITLPFDQHHILAQLLGGVLLFVGLTRWR